MKLLVSTLWCVRGGLRGGELIKRRSKWLLINFTIQFHYSPFKLNCKFMELLGWKIWWRRWPDKQIVWLDGFWTRIWPMDAFWWSSKRLEDKVRKTNWITIYRWQDYISNYSDGSTLVGAPTAAQSKEKVLGMRSWIFNVESSIFRKFSQLIFFNFSLPWLEIRQIILYIRSIF